MIVQSNVFCPRLLSVSCSLSATRPERFYAIAIPRGRAYATQFSSNIRRNTILQDSEPNPASTCWSLLSPSSSVIASDLPSLKLRKAKLTSGKTPLVVLLVTPAHIRLLDGGGGFIPSLLQLAVENTKPWQEFDLLAAVVDRIPQANSTAPYRSRGSHADANPSPKTRVEDGSEGISVAVLDSEAATPDLWSPRGTSNERETMSIQQRCTLSFSLPPGPGVRTQLSDGSLSQPLIKRKLQLPVTNTLFQNGRTSTLFAQRWAVSFRKESTSEHLSSEKTWLPQQTVHTDAVFADEGMRLQLDTLVHSHLVPITPARAITAAVGNIVRKISGGDASAEAAPASEELEKAITTAIQQGLIPPQQADVWALIRPQRYAVLDRATQIQGTVHDKIGYAVLSGARLHKVLSGGGGWGEKHGLLALDPDSDYSHHHRAFELSFGDDQDAEAENREALGEVVKPGDIITFYVYRSPSEANPANLHAPVFWSSSQAATATVVFGSLPSTVDIMQEVDTSEAEGQAQSELIVAENSFGMLSEQGMSLESSFLNTNVPTKRMQYLRPELHRQVYKVRRGNTATTKLDAPYTMVSIRGQPSRIPVSSEVKGVKLRALNVHLQDLMPPESSTVTATTKPAAELVQKLPNVSNQKHEAQRLIGQEDLQGDQVLARYQEKTEEEGGKVTRKEQTVKRLEALEVQSQTAERNRGIADEAKVRIKRSQGISERVAKKIAREVMKGTAKQKEQRKYRLQMLADRRGKTDDDSTSTVGFTSLEQEPYHQVTLQPEAQNVPPVTIRRYLASSGDFDHKPRAAPEQRFNVEQKYESKPIPDDVEYGNKPDSILIIREESEGKDPGTPYKGKDGNIFVVRKHLTRNPFERLQDIQQVGEMTSRDQAMGLHSQYHLALDKQLEEMRKY